MSNSSERGALNLGQVAGVEVRLSTSWFFVAILIAVMMAPRVEEVAPGLGWLKYVAGVTFAVLLYLSVLLHEVAHAVAAQRFGLPVGPITLHFLGGMTEVRSESKTPVQEFVVAIVGPLTSLVVGALALTAVLSTNASGLIGLALDGLAVANLFVGVFNLLPGIPLDGGRVVKALVWKLSGDPDKGTVAAGWGGRICALVVLLAPLWLAALGIPAQPSDWLFAVLVGLFIWGGASAALQIARVRRSLPKINARALARRTVTVSDATSIAEAVRRAQDSRAGAILTHDSTGQVTGIVSEVALGAVAEAQRPWQPVSTVARGLSHANTLAADISGVELLQVLGVQPAPEYLLVDSQNSIVGVLTTADVEAAVRGNSS